VTFEGGLGDWTISVNRASSNHVLTGSWLDMVYFNFSNTAAGTLTMMFSDTFFTSSPLPPWYTIIIGQSLASGTVQYNTFMDSNNNLFATTTLLTSYTLTPGLIDPFPFRFPGAINPGSFFSLTQVVTVTQSGPSPTATFATYLQAPEAES